MPDTKFNLAKNPVFTTRQYALLNKLSLPAASKRLATLHRHEHIQLLTRGIWVIPDHRFFSPFCCVPFLLGNESGYVSFLSALHFHGALSQIPKSIQIATTGHSRVLTTQFGIFEFFQINPRMIRKGVDWTDTPLPFQLAQIEKALLDTFYLATRKGRRFASLPEIELPEKFSFRGFNALAKSQIPAERIRIAVLNRLEPYRQITK